MSMLTKFLLNVPSAIIERVNHLDLNISSDDAKVEINSLLQNTVLFGGKRLRPLLTYLFGDLFAVNLESVAPYARAIELVHAASLAHDDVVDNATTRRGRSSINIVSSNKMAVLAGDYLLADVIVDLTKAKNLKLVEEMSLVIQDLALGEWIQHDSAKKRNYTREIIREISLKKTASVMSWCAVSPAILSGQSDNVVSYCREFGRHLGIAFQLVDDALDFSGTSNKDKFIDLTNGIVNAVTFEWLELNPDINYEFKKGGDIAALWNEKNLDLAIAKVKAEAHEHLRAASDILDVIAKEIDRTHANQFQKARKPIEYILQHLEKREF